MKCKKVNLQRLKLKGTTVNSEIQGKRCKRWADEEKQQLIDMYNEGMNLERISYVLDRPYRGIETQLKYLRAQHLIQRRPK